jgi:replication factor C subunit 2/4
MRILEGVQTLLQLSGCIARLCRINMKPGVITAPAHDLV